MLHGASDDEDYARSESKEKTRARVIEHGSRADSCAWLAHGLRAFLRILFSIERLQV